MTITNGYGDLTGYKLRFFDGDTDDHKDDEILERVIEAVSRQIDKITGRQFYASTQTRYYTPSDPHILFVDDLLSVTTLKTDQDGDRTYEITWDTGDYDLYPENAATDGGPYSWIETAVLGTYSFPMVRRSVEIAGSFGYCSSTDLDTDAPEIREACYMAAHRLMRRFDTPLGVSASVAMGQLQMRVSELQRDPDFIMLVDPYRRIV